MIKLIASDMDGTLVASNHQISAKNVAAIKEAQAAGIEFIISTGRSYEDAREQVQVAGLKCNYLLMNGSELRDMDGNIIQTLYMDSTLVEDVVKKLQEEKLYIELHTTKGTFSISSKEECKWATATKINFFFPEISIEEAYLTVEDHEQFKKIHKIDSLADIFEMNAEVGKIISFSADHEKLIRLRKEIAAELQASTSGSFPINLEITDPHANKGAAIKRYAQEKGIALDTVMTIGDSFNDLPMLDPVFGYTVAMGNALDEVKKAAKYITKSNDEDGVGYFIEECLKEKEIAK